jgi:hypothetical protein
MKRLNENIGAVTITRRSADQLFEPDFVQNIPQPILTGRGSATPTHWNNSPFLSGGNYGSGALNFGANPKSKNKRSIMSYGDFIKRNKEFTNK